MTSSTLDNSTASMVKLSRTYAVITLACALFGAIYELFSHEVYSYFMIYAFVVPLVLGTLLSLRFCRAKARVPGRLALNAWNSGVATLTVGCIFKGALDIYGTTNRLVVVYPIAAALLLIAGAVFHCWGANVGATPGVTGNVGGYPRCYRF